MPTLVIQYRGRTRYGTLAGPLLIGRHPVAGIIVPDPLVSRLHAWIGVNEAGGHFIASTTRNGDTLLNGAKVESRTPLREGDTIVVGPVTVRFHADDAPPPLPLDARPMRLRWKGPPCESPDQLIKLRCACGKSRMVNPVLANEPIKCRSCDQVINRPTAKAPAAWAASMNQICGICQTAVGVDERTSTCPACQLVYHAECWAENRGCAAYGCSQVNALEAAAAATVDEDEDAATATASASDAPPFPWDYLLLGGSVLAIPAGALAFGLPSVAVGGAAGWLMRSDRLHKPILGLSAALSVLGLVAGIGLSRLWWLHGGRF